MSLKSSKVFPHEQLPEKQERERGKSERDFWKSQRDFFSFPEEESVATRTLFRTILMYGFHCCVWVFAVKKIRDTQCGFKVRTHTANRANGFLIVTWMVN